MKTKPKSLILTLNCAVPVAEANVQGLLEVVRQKTGAVQLVRTDIFRGTPEEWQARQDQGKPAAQPAPQSAPKPGTRKASRRGQQATKATGTEGK